MPDQQMGMWGSGNALTQPSALENLGKIQSLQNAGLQNKLLQGYVQQQQPQIDNAKLENAQKHAEFMAARLAPLLALGDNVTPQDVTREAMDAMRLSNGSITPQEIATWTTKMVTHPQGIAAGLRASQLATMDVMNRIATLRGQTYAVGTGDGTQFVQQNAFNGGMQPANGGFVQRNPEPGLTDGPTVQTPNGPQATKISNQAALDIANGKATVDAQGRIIYPGSQGAQPAQPAQTAGDGQIVVNPGPSVPKAGTGYRAGPNAANVVVGGQAMAVGPVAGATEAASSTAQNSAAQGNSLQRAADAVPTTKATIANLESNLAKFDSGPLAPYLARYGKTFNQISGAVGGPQIAPDKIAAVEEAHKQAAQLVQQQFQALGGTGTDQQFASVNGTVPNETLSSMGNKALIAMAKGLQDATTVKNDAWQKWKAQNGANSYGQFAQDFNSKFSPRAFQFVYLTPAQRKEMVQSMTPSERSQLNAALETSEQRGWIKPSGGQ